MARIISLLGPILVLITVSSCAVDHTGIEVTGSDAARPETAPGAVELGVDEIRLMRPGGFSRLEPDFFGDHMPLLGVDHVLRAEVPGGWADVFTARALDRADRFLFCSVTIVESADSGSGGGGCGHDPPRARGRSLVVGSGRNERFATYEVVAPVETTHLIAEMADRRVAVVPVDGYALVWAQACLDSLSAWNGEELLGVERPACMG